MFFLRNDDAEVEREKHRDEEDRSPGQSKRERAAHIQHEQAEIHRIARIAEGAGGLTALMSVISSQPESGPPGRTFAIEWTLKGG